MAALLAKPAKVEYEWLALKDLLSRLAIPREKVASVGDLEEEQLRRSMEEDPQGFFDRSPILITTYGDRANSSSVTGMKGWRSQSASKSLR